MMRLERMGKPSNQTNARNHSGTFTPPNHVHNLKIRRSDSHRRPSVLQALAANALDRFSATRLGQIVLLHLMRALHILELASQWMWPDADDAADQSLVATLRPLPWFFVPHVVALLCLLRLWAGNRVVGRLQSLQRRLRAVRYKGLRKLSQSQRNVLLRCLGAMGWSSSLVWLDRSVTRTERCKSDDDTDDTDDSDTSEQSLPQKHDVSIEVLMERSFKSDGESSDSSYCMPSDAGSSDLSTGDSDEVSEDSDLQEYVERQRRATVSRLTVVLVNCCNCNLSNQPQEANKHHRQQQAQLQSQLQAQKTQKHNGNHQQAPPKVQPPTAKRQKPNESTSGVESMDAQPFCGTGDKVPPPPPPPPRPSMMAIQQESGEYDIVSKIRWMDSVIELLCDDGSEKSSRLVGVILVIGVASVCWHSRPTAM